VGDIDHSLLDWVNSGRKPLGCTEYENQNSSYSYWYSRARKLHLFSHKSKRAENLFPFASADDVTVDESFEVGNDVEARRIRLDQALQNEDYNGGLVQSLYDTARVFELSIKERTSLSKFPWFSAAWLGVDKNAWIKTLSYQVALISSINVDFLLAMF